MHCTFETVNIHKRNLRPLFLTSLTSMQIKNGYKTTSIRQWTRESERERKRYCHSERFVSQWKAQFHWFLYLNCIISVGFWLRNNKNEFNDRNNKVNIATSIHFDRVLTTWCNYSISDSFVNRIVYYSGA